MLLILLSWIYPVRVISLQGELINYCMFRSRLKTIGESFLLGMVFQTIVVTVFAFFYRIHIEYFCLNVVFTAALFFRFGKVWREKIIQLTHWDRFCKILLLLVILLSAVRSSLFPFLIDNETYYIQTIEWINEYGWVKGLANLHVYLSHGSGWHALQAAYNLNFCYARFNDINGLLICLTTCLWLEKINTARKYSEYQTNRWLFFLPVFFIFWFQFVDAPSVDLPLFLITLIVIYLVLNRTKDGSLLAILLSVFLIFLKFSIVPILVLIFFLLNKKNWKVALCYSLFLGIIYVVKGVWLSGCPFAPYMGFSFPLDWTVPKGINVIAPEDNFNFKSFGSNDLMSVILFVFSSLAYVLYAWVSFKRRKELPVFLFFTLAFLLILFSYSQFRYLLPVLFYPVAFLLSGINLKPRLLSILIYLSVLITAIPVFIGFEYGRLLNITSTLLRVDTFQIRYLIQPSYITKYPELTYEQKPCLNFYYFNPSDQSGLIYLTGDGPVPCVKKSYLRFMYKKTGSLPMMRGSDPEDGFKSIPIDKEKE